jgi:hypothetical protein
MIIGDKKEAVVDIGNNHTHKKDSQGNIFNKE